MKAVEGSSQDPTAVMYQQLSAGNKENHKKPVRIASVPAKI
jgi:hypothetical protein